MLPRFFTRITFSQDEDEAVNAITRDINKLEVTTANPVLMELFDDYTKQRLSYTDFLSILRLVESYAFRHAICDIPTNSLNKTFATLMRDVDKDNYRESVEALLLLKDSYRRFSRNDEFQQHLTTRNIYDLSKRHSYLLEKLEN